VTRPTSSAVDFLPTADVLLRDPRLVYTLRLAVLGLWTRFETNSRYVYDVMEDAFGRWRGLGGVQAPPSAGDLRVRVVVREGNEDDSSHAPVRYLCPDDIRVILHSPGSVAVSDPSLGESVAFVTTALAADRAHFRLTVLEAITLALLSHFDRHPIHAAAIAHSGRAVLLTAPSGTGKSTLSYMAHAAGLDVLGEDHVWVQLTPRLRIWGWPGPVHLSPDVAVTIPDAARVGTTTSENGRNKIVINLDTISARSSPYADEAVVCILERGRDKPTLERLEPATVTQLMVRQLTSGFDRFPARNDAVIRALTMDGGWRLKLSDDPNDALPFLRRMLDEG